MILRPLVFARTVDLMGISLVPAIDRCRPLTRVARHSLVRILMSIVRAGGTIGQGWTRGCVSSQMFLC
jgi:hypothetical protein